MRNINSKFVLWIILVIALIVFIINYLCSAQQISLCYYIVNSLTSSISVITIIAIIFNKYLWQLSIFKNWLVLVPNLNGKWRGVINPDWVSPITKEKSEPIETSLSIKQSLVHISCVMITSEMKSHSITYDFMIDASNQVLKLGYIYMSEPNLNVREKSQIHYGTTIFDIVKLEDNHIQLKGGYWTDRKTSGTINLSKD